MLDLKLLEKNFDEIDIKLKNRGLKEEQLNQLKEFFGQYKTQKKELEELQAKQNRLSKLFGTYKSQKKDIDGLKKELEENKSKIAATQKIVKKIEESLNELALQIPNIPDSDVPIGKDENDNIELKKVLDPKEFDFEPKEHWELA
ncbi:MAG TPA: serine--tRNA ligase, partial [Campylobacterales bacterium]|nr:serine--tRNA ligase [Campylobacterales bacterium]